ncbi:hypothetical protein [Burkholderia plantarii]|uniref:hypothetical protein n=1 Tax=Burkholderia plantarii TaxID=41899 RepID=UPI000ADF4301|nr:hypothetical protein [Burkholderia plantarii]WLE62663.1 hypothetical protein GIY62_19890 [Burkholderia plantarii]
MSDTQSKLRSQRWSGTTDNDGFMSRSWMKNPGNPDHEAGDRPIIRKTRPRRVPGPARRIRGGTRSGRVPGGLEPRRHFDRMPRAGGRRDLDSD